MSRFSIWPLIRRRASPAGRAGWRGGVTRDNVGAALPPAPAVSVLNELSTIDFTEATDPFALFELWFEEAKATEINDPEAMTLATVDADGLPDARMVLCKGADRRGLVFYTNIESAKGRELEGQPRAAALFHWKSLRRQVRFRGAVAEVSAAESDAYFASRPRGSQIGAWASRQSRPLASRAELEAAVETYERRFGTGGCPGRTIGAAIGSSPSRSSSGATVPHDCTIGSCSSAQGRSADWEKRLLYP